MVLKSVIFGIVAILIVLLGPVTSVACAQADTRTYLPQKYNERVQQAEQTNKSKCSSIPQEGEKCDGSQSDTKEQQKSTTSTPKRQPPDDDDEDTPKPQPRRSHPSRSDTATVCAVNGGGFCPLLTVGAPQNAPCSCQVPVAVPTPYGWQSVIRLVFGLTR